MRFTYRLYRQSSSEWMDCYINYVQLKMMVILIKDSVMERKNINKAIQKKKQSSSGTTNFELEILNRNNLDDLANQFKDRYKKMGDEIHQMFCQSLEKQINLFTDFVKFKYQQIEYRFHKIIAYRELTKNQKGSKRKKIAKPFVEYLFVESYILSIMVSLNIESQRKLLEKHKLYSENVYQTPIPRVQENVSIDKCNTMYRTIEHYYFDEISRRKKKEDRFRLRKLAEQVTQKSSQLLPVGVMIGLFVATAAFLAIILAASNINLEKDPIFNKDFSHWRGIAFIIFYIWSLGINMYFYEKYNINHRVVLENNYTMYPTSVGIFRFASVFSVLFVVFFSLYALQVADLINLGRLPPQLLAIFVWAPFILFMINPFHLVYHRARGYTYKLLLKIIASVVIPITFPIIWGTDQLVSLFIPFQDLIETVCYYSTFNLSSQGQQVLQTYDCRYPATIATFVFSLVVYSLRIIQCLKVGFCQSNYWKKSQFLNSIKYGLALIMTVLSFIWKRTNNSTILPFWIAFGAITTIFSFIWDLRVDWDLLHLKSHNFLLRDRLTYDKHSYYICIFINFLLRCTWIFYISPAMTQNILGSVELFILIFGLLEIARRGMWNMFRVQVEHIRNCQVLRALPKDYERLQQKIDKQLAQSKINNKVSIESMQRIIDEQPKQPQKKISPEKQKFIDRQKQLMETAKRKRKVTLGQKQYLKGLLKEDMKMKNFVEDQIHLSA